MHDLLEKEEICNLRIYYKSWLVICRQKMVPLETTVLRARLINAMYYYYCYVSSYDYYYYY